MENDVCAILALHLRSRRLISGTHGIGAWLGQVTADDLRRDHWLLIYEAALRNGWPIPGAAAAVGSSDFFGVLKNEGVSFYDTRSYNRPLNLPGINWSLRAALGVRKRAILPGAIIAVRTAEPIDYEQLGGDYGEDDWSMHLPEPDYEDDIPV